MSGNTAYVIGVLIGVGLLLFAMIMTIVLVLSNKKDKAAEFTPPSEPKRAVSVGAPVVLQGNERRALRSPMSDVRESGSPSQVTESPTQDDKPLRRAEPSQYKPVESIFGDPDDNDLNINISRIGRHGR